MQCLRSLCRPTEATGANGSDRRLVEAGPGRKDMVKAGVWGQGPLTKESIPCYLHGGEEATKGSSGEAPLLHWQKEREEER